MPQHDVKKFEQDILARVSGETLHIVIGYIEEASEELTSTMIYTDDAEKTRLLQGMVRGYKDVAYKLRRLNEQRAGRSL